MIKIFTSLFYILMVSAAFAQTKYKLDSLIYNYRDSLGNLVKSNKNEFKYDSIGNCIEDFSSYLNNDNGKWTIGSKTFFYFDHKHNDTLTYSTNWDDKKQKYIYYNKYVEVYDNYNIRTSMTQFNLDTNSNKWVRIWKRFYTYDSQNRILTETYLDSAATLLKNSSKYVYEYTPTANNKYSYIWRNNTWELSMLDEGILDAFGDEIKSSTYLNWGGGANENPNWRNSSKYEHTYNATHDRTGTHYFSWEAKTLHGEDYQWIPKSYNIYKYDVFHNMIYAETQSWNKIQQKYLPEYKNEWVYNTDVTYRDLLLTRNFSNDNQPSSAFMYMLLQSKFSGFVDNKWTEHAPNNYYYSPYVITDVQEKDKNYFLFAFPNPMKDVLHVSIQSSLMDILGNKVAEGGSQIDVSKLIKGIYFVQSDLGSIKVVKE